MREEGMQHAPKYNQAADRGGTAGDPDPCGDCGVMPRPDAPISDAEPVWHINGERITASDYARRYLGHHHPDRDYLPDLDVYRDRPNDESDAPRDGDEQPDRDSERQCTNAPGNTP
jgi:hypothetical protein